MNNLVEIQLTGSADVVLRKLTRADIAVYRFRVSGAAITFCVEEEYVKKVFAIFAHRCYNVGIRRTSARKRIAAAVRRRVGLIVGAAIFLVAAVAADFTVLRVKVTGNCAYLAEDIRQIAAQCGVREWSLCLKADIPSLEARVLSLDGVSFCSVARKGSYMIIDVMSGGEENTPAAYTDFVSPESGRILRIVAVSGTPLAAEGEDIRRGEKLIGAYAEGEDGQRRSCLAVGFADIEVSRTVSVLFGEKSEENARAALGIAALYSENVISRSYTVSESQDGAVYDVSFSYICTVSVNME